MFSSDILYLPRERSEKRENAATFQTISGHSKLVADSVLRLDDNWMIVYELASELILTIKI